MTDPQRLTTETNGFTYITTDGNLHSEDDEPSCVYPDGTRWWYRNGQIHRDGGPAVIWSNGVEEWFQNGKRHREDGPAVTYPDTDAVDPTLRGVKRYYVHGQLSRDDIPPKVAAYRRELETLQRKHFGGPS